MGQRPQEMIRDLIERLEHEQAESSLLDELKNIARAMNDALFRQEEENRHFVGQLAQAARLAELGTMAAAIFHEMNQPLLGVKGFAELIQEGLRKNKLSNIASWSAEIRKQVIRLQGMQEQVADFMRQGSQSQEAVEVRVAVNEALGLFERRCHKRQIELNLRIPDDLPAVQVNPSHLNHILVNLLANAFDAVDGLPHKQIAVVARTGEEPDTIKTVVTNSGPGISEEVCAQLFEPFFSTKGSKGTGLGLYVARRLAELNGGQLELIASAESDLADSTSTTFQLTLKTIPDPEP